MSIISKALEKDQGSQPAGTPALPPAPTPAQLLQKAQPPRNPAEFAPLPPIAKTLPPQTRSNRKIFAGGIVIGVVAVGAGFFMNDRLRGEKRESNQDYSKILPLPEKSGANAPGTPKSQEASSSPKTEPDAMAAVAPIPSPEPPVPAQTPVVVKVELSVKAETTPSPVSLRPKPEKSASPKSSKSKSAAAPAKPTPEKAKPTPAEEKPTPVETKAEAAESSEPSPPPKPAHKSSSSEIRESYKLEGIFWSEKDPMAIINGEIVQEGKRLEGVLVKKINKSSVTLEADGEEFELK